MAPEEPTSARCFMAMPIKTRAEDGERFSDTNHWHHVMISLFEKAIIQAGFDPVRPVAQGSHLIHGEIIRQLSTAELVLVDLSTHNPNVFFELGVRTSLNLPVALVRDEHTELPFDTAGINTHTYDSNLRGWEIEGEQEKLADHIRQSVQSCHGNNPLWRQFGLTITAQQPDAGESPLDAKIDLLLMQLEQLTMERSFGDKRMDEARSWSVRQLRDPSLPAPSTLFSAAVQRLAQEDAAIVQVDILSPTSAAVSIEGIPTPDLLRRIQDSADRYEVHFNFKKRPEQSMRKKTESTLINDSKKVKNEREIYRASSR